MNVCLYHSNCSDGFCAAYVVNKAFMRNRKEVQCIPASYDAPPDIHDVDELIVVDVSWDKQTMLDLRSKCKSMIVLDHHKTAQANLKDMPFCIFDMNRSGAGLAWDYFFSDEPRPHIVSYIEDRDLWRFSLPKSKLISRVVSYTPYDLEAYEDLSLRMDDDLSEVAAEGEAINAVIESQVSEVVSNVRYCTFMDEGRCALINCTDSKLISDACNKLLIPGVDFSLAWRMLKDGRIYFSLRSDDTRKDVSAIALKAHGGGHRNASGGIFNTISDFMACIKFVV